MESWGLQQSRVVFAASMGWTYCSCCGARSNRVRESNGNGERARSDKRSTCARADGARMTVELRNLPSTCTEIALKWTLNSFRQCCCRCGGWSVPARRWSISAVRCHSRKFSAALLDRRKLAKVFFDVLADERKLTTKRCQKNGSVGRRSSSPDVLMLTVKLNLLR